MRSGAFYSEADIASREENGPSREKQDENPAPHERMSLWGKSCCNWSRLFPGRARSRPIPKSPHAAECTAIAGEVFVGSRSRSVERRSGSQIWQVTAGWIARLAVMP
ncbi:hypothetical protein GCM10019059_26690 [Camelimonas fluminis]|nr:hypothetical protein GCM10019059_26690 [Camelimonas fluminis]